MVLRGEMTTTTRRRQERPKMSLHNFTLSNLKWGSQRHLKCMKIDSTSSGDHRLRRRSSSLRFSGSSVPIPFRFGKSEQRSNNNNNQVRKSVEKGEEGEGMEELREKIMSDLKTVRDKITQSIYALKEQHEEEERKPCQEKEVSPVKKPWNLRKRRAAVACKEPVSANQIKTGFVAIEEKTVNPRNDTMRGGVVEAETTATMRPKFSVNLSKKEIEEDFMAAFGHRAPRRPKKRPRTVQRKLDSLHPGFYLTEVTLDAYKVPEETKNMQR